MKSLMKYLKIFEDHQEYYKIVTSKEYIPLYDDWAARTCVSFDKREIDLLNKRYVIYKQKYPKKSKYRSQVLINPLDIYLELKSGGRLVLHKA